MVGETKTGFKYEIADDVLNDWEVLELLKDIEGDAVNGIDGDFGKVVYLMRKLFDAKTQKALKKHCKHNGKVLITSDPDGHPGMVETIFEIIENNGKKS